MSNNKPSSRLRLRTAIFTTAVSLLAGTGTALATRPVAGSVTPERLKSPSGPSSVRGLAGEPAVDPFYASVNYQVPIELPGGLGGLTPSLALTYSGALGNGSLGIGWALSHAKIQRSTRLGIPKFDATDELELTGIASGRLIAISPTEYRIEGMGQTIRVVTSGSGFEIDDGAGLHYKLGLTAAGRQESDPSHTLAWMCEEVTNQMGERVAYQYIHDQAQVYLSHMVWGPGDVYSVDLDYTTRPDTTRSYREGFGVTTAKLLAHIRVNAFGIEKRAYHLQYDPVQSDPSFAVSRLSGVTSTGKLGAGEWPALTFTYAAPAAPALETVNGTGGWQLNASGTTLVDLDGDGAADLLQLGSTGHQYRLNRDGVFQAAANITGVTAGITQVQLQDVDGDARAELLTENASGWQVYKWSKTQWLSQGTWPNTAGVPLKQPASARYSDLNGDGLVDAIQWNSNNLIVRFATRTALSASVTKPKIGGTEVPSDAGRFHDVNGDGIDDYVVVRTDHLDEFLGHGDGTFDNVVQVAYPLVGTWNPDNVELGDLDRDGLMDLVRVDVTTVRWFRGKANGTFSTSGIQLVNPENYNSTVVVAVTDSNGNGSQDVVWSSPNGTKRMDLAGTTTAGMLTRVQNGLGMDVTFAYRSSHSLSAEAKNNLSPWTSEVPISMPVPVQKVTALGPSDVTRQVDYSVRDGFWDAVEQRFGGFLTTQVTTWGATPDETSSVLTRYLNSSGTNRELRGKPQTEQIKNGNGTRLSLTTYTWDTMVVQGLPNTPLLRAPIMKEKKVRYEDTTPVRETDTVITYDLLGRANHEIDYGRDLDADGILVEADGDEAVKDTTYADDATYWIRNKVCEEKVSELSGTVVSDVQHLFGDNTAVQPLCVVGKGWSREDRAWLASEARWVSQQATSYDSHGNPTAITKGGITTQLVFDANGLFPIEEHHQSTTGDPDMVWTADWDEVLGVIATATEPNGHQTHSHYDSLGRFIGASVDNQPDQQVIEYDWTPPYPKTTSWTFDGPVAQLGPNPGKWYAGSQWRQTVEVANGIGETRYRAQRLDDQQWIISDYRERDPNSRVIFAGRPMYSTELDIDKQPGDMVGDVLRYDPLGRLIEQIAPNGSTRSYGYTAFERVTRDADLAEVHSVLDGQGRAIKTYRELSPGNQEVVQASYDAAGRLTHMWLAGGTVDRTFGYDTLGRLISSSDPDLGARSLTWDDGGRLLTETNAMQQTVSYGYDGYGRLSTRDSGSLYTYHYDRARQGAGSQITNVMGRLAWIEEPTGGSDVGYDEQGRATFTRRRIDAKSSEATTAYASSGLVLSRGYDDGFAMSYEYDPAGRLQAIPGIWQVRSQDASGAPLLEVAQNGVSTEYERDVMGLTSHVTVRDVEGIAIYDVQAARNAWSAITTIEDLDGVGLDHSASFGYDSFARLTSASIGSGADVFSFGYAYDLLHNMTARTMTGPHPIGGFFGTQHYAENGHAPRQLTSITGAAGVEHTFDYDAAGRQTAQDDLLMTYDASDRLVEVDGLPGGSVLHSYGQDGQRVKTVAPDGGINYFFGDGTAERNGVREHDVTVGERVVARIAMVPDGSGLSATTAFDPGAVARRWYLALAALLAMVGGAALVRRRRG